MCSIPLSKKSEASRVVQQDAGWAWVIMVASFTAQLIIDGTLSGFGVMFLAMQSDQAFLNANYTLTQLAISGSMQTGFFLCTGAFASPFIQRFGFRIVGGLGSFLVSMGMATASVQTNIHLFNFLYGLVAGSGFGIMMVCAIVSVNYYFERFRGIASGVAMSGAGVGYLIIPFLFNELVQLVGWRKALLGYAVGIFPLTLFAMLAIRPFVLDNIEQGDLDPYLETDVDGEKQNHRSEEFRMSEPSEDIIKQTDHDNLPETTVTEGVRVGKHHSEGIVEDGVQQSGKLASPIVHLVKQYLARESKPRQQIDSRDVMFGTDFGSTVGSRLWKSTQGCIRDCSGLAVDGSHHAAVNKVCDSNIHLSRTTRISRRKMILDPFQQLDIYFSSNLAVLATHDSAFVRKASINRTSAIHSALKLDHTPDRSCFGSGYSIGQTRQADANFLPPSSSHISFTSQPDRHVELSTIDEDKPELYSPQLNQHLMIGKDQLDGDSPLNSDYYYEPTMLQRLRLQLVVLFDLELFRSSAFIFILLIGVTNQLAYFIPFVYLVDFAASKGISRNEAILLLVILGSLHTFGRIVAGCAANIPAIDTVYLSGFGTLAMSVFSLLLPVLFPTSFAWYSIYAVLFGFSCALPIPMIHILLVRFLGLERLTGSYSNLNLFKGIASVIGPLAAVDIVARTGQTDHYFYVASCCFLLSSLAHLGLCKFPCSGPFQDGDLRASCCIYSADKKETA